MAGGVDRGTAYEGDEMIEKTGEKKTKEQTSDKQRTTKRQRPMTPYERTRAAVYATGNKWAIENFEATH